MPMKDPPGAALPTRHAPGDDSLALGAEASAPAELVRRIREGEAAAEEEMVERYSWGLTFLLRRLTGDQARADDLYQETFRLVIEKVRAGELREPEKLSAFVQQLARNLFIADCRKSTRHPTVGGHPAVEASADSGPGPLQRLLARENAAIVRRLLAELEPPRDREILLRFFVAERPKEEICADLGLSSLHFNRVLYRARQRLKDLLLRYHKRHRLPVRLASEGGGEE